MAYGYRQKLLRINLSDRSIKVEEIPEQVLKLYMGGSGLGIKYLIDETAKNMNPLDSENVLGFFAGPATGTMVPTSGRHAVVSRSPLTGLWGESDVGGRWGWNLKRAGYDGILITGSSDEPVYVVISNDGVEIRRASHLWGKDTYETDELIKCETDHNVVVGSIGQAGENLVKIASIMFDGRDARAAGRTGLGAVMGSKKLKAVVVRGSEKVEVFDSRGIRKLLRDLLPGIKEGTKGLSQYGTAGSIGIVELVGDLPIKNWQLGSWTNGVEKISGQAMGDSILVGRFFCASCVIGCGRTTEVKDGPYKTSRGAGPEYETLAQLGAMCLIDNLEAINYATDLCNRYGLDTISTGALIAFAMEAFEKGFLSPSQTGGLCIKWGDVDVLIQLISDIAFRRGMGDILADGLRNAVQRLGIGRELDIQVKGLEPPGHDPRAYNSIGIGYATSNRGACHLQGFTHVLERSVTLPELGYPEIADRFSTVGKGILAARSQDLMAILDSMKMCKFALFGGIKVTHVLTWFNYVTGLCLDMREFLTIGERIFNLKRLYNVRLGVNRQDDSLPWRILKEKRGTGGAADNLPPLEEMLDEYYEYRGWDRHGLPTKRKLQELGIEEEYWC